MDKEVQKKEGERSSYGKAEGRAAPGRRCRAGRPCRWRLGWPAAPKPPQPGARIGLSTRHPLQSIIIKEYY
jgi:hypothetical protein